MIAAVLAGCIMAGALWFPARNRDRRLTSGCVIGDQL